MSNKKVAAKSKLNNNLIISYLQHFLKLQCFLKLFGTGSFWHVA